MKIQIDSPSAMLGLLAGVLGTLLVGASSTSSQAPSRYQAAGTGSHAIIVDTTTGEAWSAFLNATGGKTDTDFYQRKTGERK